MNAENNTPRILLISSRMDPAGTLIHEEIFKMLRDDPVHARLYRHEQYDERLIYLDGPGLKEDVDLIIFLSRHASQKPRSVLTVHVTGNFNLAEFGGTPRTLTPAATMMMHAIMKRMAIEVPEGYEVTYEATHHGPTGMKVPSCFVEVGSTEKEWNDRVAAAAVARSVLGAVPSDTIPLAGFGGTHYAKRQTEIALTTRGGFGHIVPTRDLPYIDESRFKEIVGMTGAKGVYIDRKSMPASDIARIEQYADDFKIPVLGQTDLSGLGSLPFDDYCTIIRIAEEIIPKSSVIVHALKRAPEPVVVRMPADLIAETIKVAQEDFWKSLDEIPVAHLSGNGISCHPVFITDRENLYAVPDDLTDLCLTILKKQYGTRITIEKSADEIVLEITETKFDPRVARELGVQPGKDFGILASGGSIMVEDTEITPGQVMFEHHRKIRIPVN